MGVKMTLRIITKNRKAHSEIGFPTKSILKPYGRSAVMPIAWELETAPGPSVLNKQKSIKL